MGSRVHGSQPAPRAALEPRSPGRSISTRSATSIPKRRPAGCIRVRCRALPRCPAAGRCSGASPSTSAPPRRASLVVLLDRPLTIALGGERRRATSSWPTCATPGGTTPAGARRASGRPRRPGRRAPGGLRDRGCRRHATVAASSGAGSRSTTGSSAGVPAPSRRSPHLDNEVADWRGPHEAQTPGRYAPAGQSGSLTIMPGTYGANQVGMTDFVPERRRRRPPLVACHRRSTGRRAADALQRRAR